MWRPCSSGILVYGPWRDPQGYNFPQTRMFTEFALLPLLLDGTRLHLGIVVTIGLALVAWVMMARTIIGFQVKVVGQAPAAARFAGFSRNRMVWLSLLLSGGLAGLAGAFEVAGPIGQLVPHLTPGYGFTAIIVAFLGRLHPLGIVAAGFLMAVVLHRRRDRPGRGRSPAGRHRRLPGHAAVLPSRLRFPRPAITFACWRAAGRPPAHDRRVLLISPPPSSAPRRRCCSPRWANWWSSGPASSIWASRE